MNIFKWLAVVYLLCSGAALAQDVSGTWQTEPGNTGGFLHVSLAPCGDKICGTITNAFDADRKVVTNYEHAGKKMIWDMTEKSAGSWNKGKIWAPDVDKTYSSKMSLSGNRLKVSGCVAGGLICRSQNWVRVQ